MPPSQHKGREEELHQREEQDRRTRKMPEKVKKRKTAQKKFHPGKNTAYETVELSSLKDSD